MVLFIETVVNRFRDLKTNQVLWRVQTSSDCNENKMWHCLPEARARCIIRRQRAKGRPEPAYAIERTGRRRVDANGNVFVQVYWQGFRTPTWLPESSVSNQ
jgi:hypothetical protein